ncbi:hypothetical protein PsYK624_115580 [Phanerochaete sordida]|uniref:F-box domain-containing protein n=1 Tax=Phanerochaete sordida TaxID=48140 RepID=A0A9P3GKX7_9APHY|nr:hypothetical protein PsYK624_115580 [Phanerochaete sordida]
MAGANKSSALRPALSKLRRLSLLRHNRPVAGAGPRLKLNLDVIFHVMTLLELEDLLRIMCTSRTLYELGLPIVLAHIQVTSKNPAFSLLYRRHLLQDTTRLSKVRSLCSTYKALDDYQHSAGHRVYEKYQPFPEQYRLTDLLPQFNNLEVLEIAMEGANVTPTFCAWIRTLKRLRMLKLLGVGPRAEPLKTLLPDLPPNLKAVHIVRIRRRVDDSDWQPLQLLAHSWTTLESFAFEAYDRFRGPTLPPWSTMCLPAVRDLSWVSRNAVQLDALMRIFPAVATLRVGHVRLDTPGFGVGTGLSADAQMQQREHNLRAQQAGAGWARLERLEGGLLSLWTLALRCRVAHVETALRAWPHANLGHLVMLLHDTKPRRLTLTTYPEHLAQLSRVLNFATLEALELRVDVVVKDRLSTPTGESGIFCSLRDTFEEVYQSGLRRLTLIIRIFMDVPEISAYLRASRMGDVDLHRPPPAKSLDPRWRALVDRVFKTVTLLEHLALEVWGNRTLISTRSGSMVAMRESTTEMSWWDPGYMNDEGIWPILHNRMQ